MRRVEEGIFKGGRGRRKESRGSRLRRMRELLCLWLCCVGVCVVKMVSANIRWDVERSRPDADSAGDRHTQSTINVLRITPTTPSHSSNHNLQVFFQGLAPRQAFGKLQCPYVDHRPPSTCLGFTPVVLAQPSLSSSFHADSRLRHSFYSTK